MFNLTKTLKYMILIVPIITLVGVSAYVSKYFTDYNNRVNTHYLEYNDKISKHINLQKDKEIQKYTELKQVNGKRLLNRMLVVFDDKYEQSKIQVRKDLQTTVNNAYKRVKKIKRTKEIKIKLKQMNKKLKSTDVFLVNYRGDTLLGSNSIVDIDARTIVLEEIQKVRKRGSGFITSNIDNKGTKRHIFVKDLGVNHLFIGANLYVKNNTKLRKNLLIEVEDIFLENDECISINELNKNIYKSLSCNDNLKNKHYSNTYFKALDWKLTYSFDSSKKIQTETQKVKDFEKLLEYKVF